ncbi:hypothetical protein H4696_000325 [Amycolatopsis lexingtonensis]|uniref:Uncharacterized protein n=1 Tax=Amycolatopsis lexingtonensis TaxID=218822 RepID=A0ABR9HQK9_9PSEU|nr:hypothetical protein [Amycolatopsis lexingtonensis]MBE1493225.1 hypothetical protein [Amycolatopsis lexingtonensis]
MLKRTLTSVALLAAACLPGLPPAAAAGCTWAMTPLALPAPYTSSDVFAAAEGGWFLGQARSATATPTVRWHGGQLENIDSSSRLVEARDINSAGDVVGDGGTGDWWAAKPVVYRGGQYVNLPMPQGFRSAKATHINNAGDVVGVAYGDFGGDVHPVLWAAARPGTAEVLNPDPQHLYDTYPVDVDEQGRVLLYTDVGERSGEVFIRAADGGYRQLPPLYPGGSVLLEAFHGGRIAASVVTPELTMVAVEADLDGHVVHTTTEAADTLFVDAGTTMAGVAHTFDPGHYELRVWENGEPAADLAGDADFNAAPRPAGLTDDGALAATITWPDTGLPRAVTYHRGC